MDRKIIAIALLTITAVALLMAEFSPPNAIASTAVNGRDYQAVTAKLQSGGEGLYLVDNHSGLIAIFSYDPNTRMLRPRAVRAIADAFPTR